MSKFKSTTTAAFAILITTSTWAEGDDGIHESRMVMDENGNLVMTTPQLMEDIESLLTRLLESSRPM